MKFFRTDLLTLLISLFIFCGCKNQDSLGLGVASVQTNSNFTDTSTITINTVKEDTVITSGLAKTPLALFNDPVFGITESDIASNLSLPGETAYTPPTGTVTIDSARLVVSFANGFYGDSLESVYKVNVYQLNELYLNNQTYSNRKQWKVNYNNLLGSLTFNARTHDSIKIYNIIAGAPDTLIKVAPQIRIPINPGFISDNFFNASTTTLSSNTIFQNNVQGLYLTLDKAKTTGAGGIIMVKSDTLAVYYRANNGSTVDTAVAYLPVTHMAANIIHTPSPVIQTELNDSTVSRATFYLQGLGGLRAKIRFPNLLKNFRDSLLAHGSDVVINRAELVVTPGPGSNIPYQPLPQITMYKLDIAHQRQYIQDANPADPRSGGATVFGGFYSSSLNSYHFIITGYLQDLLFGKTVDYGTYIAPIDLSTTISSANYTATDQVAGRTIAVGADKTSQFRIKLNIIYTKISLK